MNENVWEWIWNGQVDNQINIGLRRVAKREE